MEFGVMKFRSDEQESVYCIQTAIKNGADQPA